MKLQEIAFCGIPRKRIRAWIGPDVRPVPAILSKLHVVLMGTFAAFEHKYEFVLAAVKRTHPCIVLGPYAYVLQLGICLSTSGEEFTNMTPVHADEVNGSFMAIAGHQIANIAEEIREAGCAHFARGHDEIVVLYFAQA